MHAVVDVRHVKRVAQQRRAGHDAVVGCIQDLLDWIDSDPACPRLEGMNVYPVHQREIASAECRDDGGGVAFKGYQDVAAVMVRVAEVIDAQRRQFGREGDVTKLAGIIAVNRHPVGVVLNRAFLFVKNQC